MENELVVLWTSHPRYENDIHIKFYTTLVPRWGLIDGNEKAHV